MSAKERNLATTLLYIAAGGRSGLPDNFFEEAMLESFVVEYNRCSGAPIGQAKKRESK